MCDQSEVQYNDGDVVWVKLGPCWWPGEVHDIKKVPPEIQPGLKKPPIAFVHFFGEDKYEYVKSYDHIYHYNCRRKDEFLKKGFHAYRAKHKHMGKFPEDVKMAETLTDGDPNIMESEKYQPEEKPNYRNIFASPSPSKKSTPKSGGKVGRGRKSVSGSRPSGGDNYRRNSLNPYLDYSYEVHDLSVDSSMPTPITLENSTTNIVYDCPKCNFTCTRLNVIVLHHKSHNLDEFGLPLKGKKKAKESPTNKLPRIARCFTSTIDEDLELLSKGIDICAYSDSPKKKFKTPKIKLPKTPKPSEKKKINNKKDVKGILADWEDSESEKEEEKLDKSSSSENLDKSQNTVDDSKTSISNKDLNKSCFDFEEEEDIATIISKSPGRKIPRVIPESQKTKSSELIVTEIAAEVNDQSKTIPDVTASPKDEANAAEVQNSSEKENKSTENKILDIENKITEIENKVLDDGIKSPVLTVKSKGKRGRKSKAELEEIRRQEIAKENENQEEIKDNLEKEFDVLMAETVLPELPKLPSDDTSSKQTEDTPETIKLPDKKTRGRKKSETPKQETVIEPVPEPQEVAPTKTERRNKRKSEHQVLKEKSPEIIETELKPETVNDVEKEIPSEDQTSAPITEPESPKIEKRGRRRAETLKEKILMQAELEESKSDKRNKKKVEIAKETTTEPTKQSKRKQDIAKEVKEPSPVAEFVQTVLKIEDRRGRRRSEQLLKDKSPEFVEEKKTKRKGDVTLKDKSPEPVIEQVKSPSQRIIKDKSPELFAEKENDITKTNKRGRKKSESSFKEKSPVTILEKVSSPQPDDKIDTKEKPELVVKEKTEPVVKEKVEPVIKEKTESVAKEKTESVAKEKTEPVVKEKTELVAKEKTEPVAKEKTEPIAKEKTEPVVKEKTEPVAKEKIESVVKAKTESIVKAKTESIVKAKTESIVKEKTESIVKEKTESIVKEKTESVVKEKEISTTETRSQRKRNSSIKDHNKIEIENVPEKEKASPEQTPEDLPKSPLQSEPNEQKIAPVDDKQINEIIPDESKPDKKESPELSKIDIIPKKLRKSRFSSIKEKDEVDNLIVQEKPEEIPKETVVTEEIKSPKSRDKFEFIPKKTRRNRQEFKLIEDESLRSSESVEKSDAIESTSSKLVDMPEINKSAQPPIITEIKKSTDESTNKKPNETHEIAARYSPKKKLPKREKLDEELMEYVLETNKDLQQESTDTSASKSDVVKDTSKSAVEPVVASVKEDKNLKSQDTKDSTVPQDEKSKDIIDQEKSIIESPTVEDTSKIPEKAKIFRKRGRPSNASKAAAAAALQELNQSALEEPSVENQSSLADSKETSTTKQFTRQIKSPTRETSLSDKKVSKREQDLDLNKKDIPESTKSDESVKVMISLNDFKMEDIPLPPSPAPKSSTINLNFTGDTKQHTSKMAEKVDNTVNTSKESKEIKRTPIKFEISKIKAQINKKLTTHKSFLGDEEDSLALVRKGQAFTPEKTAVSGLKRSFNKDFIKECESPKKRVMADYKKEIDMEKNKQKKLEEKLQTEKAQEETKKQETQLKETILPCDTSKDTVSKIDSVPETDLKSEDDTKVPEKTEKPEEKLTTLPVKHEDISAVINSGTEVKIIDPNSERSEPHQSEQKIVQQIVHENIAESSNLTDDSSLNKPEIFTEKTPETEDTFQDKSAETKKSDAITADSHPDSEKLDKNSEVPLEIPSVAENDSQLTEPAPIFEESKKVLETTENKPSNESQSTLPDYVDELESIENEIQKITSSESSPCKANIFPENIALATTPTKENLTLNEPILESKELYSSQLNETGENVLLTSEIKSTPSVSTPTTADNSIESEIAKLTDTKPEEGEVIPEQSFSTTSSKLLEILESKPDQKIKIEKKLVPVTLGDKKQTFIGLTAAQKKSVALGSKILPAAKGTKFVIKSSPGIKDVKKSKPIILSEEIIKPANDPNKSITAVSAVISQPAITTTPKGATKRNFEEDLLEDKGGIKKFIIEKAVADSSTQPSVMKSRAKPTVLSQTIIKPTGKIETAVETSKESVDDNMFDINSMPIVLSDDLLTPESIENMPIVISNIPESDKSQKTLQVISKSGKLVTPDKTKFVPQQKTVGVKPIMQQTISKNQKIYQAASTKLLANKPAVITQPGKPEKFIILPPTSASPATGSKYTVGKRTIRASGQTSVVVSKSPAAVSTPTTIVDAKTKSALQAGNKVMVVTNSQGQQSRIILSPAQQKMLGSKMGTKIITRTAPVTKGTTLALNNIVTSKGTILTPTSTLVQTKTQTVSPQTVITSKGQILTTAVQNQSIITSKGQILTPVTPTQMKAIKSGTVSSGKKIQIPQKIILPAGAAAKSNLQTIAGMKTKTVLVKGSQKQIVQKIQPSTSTSQLRTVVQKGSPTIKAASPTVSPIISGKQKLAIAPKTPNVIKRQVVRGQSTSSPQSTTPQRVILQKMPSGEMKSNTTIQRASQSKTVEPKLFPKQSRPSSIVSSGQNVPPLVPLSPSQAKIAESPLSQQTAASGSQPSTNVETSVQSPKQLIIQDDMGNQTSVSQGQILAVPGGEVIDGQPQSYMLVTVDESGNLLPLDNQALMSLDPNLIGPDGNVMLQFNQGINPPETQPSLPVSSADTLTPAAVESTEIPKVQSQTVAIESPAQDYQQLLITDDQQNLIALAGPDQHLLMTENQNLILDQAVLQSPKTTSEQAVTYSISNAEDGQQILISGDPEKAQHLINVLASGSQDLSQIMSNTEGNLIINADGQHIILNADGASTEQIILATSTDGFNLQENYNSDFANQATTNQDILAAALANTVFPQESNITEGLNIVTSATGGPLMSTTSELSPSLYQNMQLPNLTSGAVLETSLTNLAPIMSPLEVPTSGTSKKVPLDIETTSQVPKSLELPITITDPNISQTVNSQLANELQNNLGLPITITDPNISNVRVSELNTSTFGYSLPNIEESVETATTTSSGPISMPLLTEDLEPESSQQENKPDESTNKDVQQPQEEATQPEALNTIFEPKNNPERNENEDIENAGNALDVLASVTTASGMISENNAELEHIFAEKKDDQLPSEVFAQNTYLNENEGKEENNECENNSVVHEPFSRSRLGDHFVLESPHSEIDANSDEISIQPSIVHDEASHSLNENSHKRSFDGLEDECSSDSKKSKFDIS